MLCHVGLLAWIQLKRPQTAHHNDNNSAGTYPHNPWYSHGFTIDATEEEDEEEGRVR